MTLYRCSEPVVFHLGDPSDPDDFYTPWGVPSPPEAIPGRSGHIMAGHLIVISSDWVEYLLAIGKTIPDATGCLDWAEKFLTDSEPTLDTTGCLVGATADGPRVFFHLFAENGHYVWELHEFVFRWGYGPDDYVYNDQSDDPVRSLLGVFPD